MAAISPTLTLMIRAAEKAARSLLRDFGEVEQLQVSLKGPGDFVSAADRRAEQIIHDELKKARPGAGFLMEERGAVAGADGESRWIVDPLDGTTNFLHGLPHWAISIAFETKGEIVAGLIHDPVKNETFHAEKGQGAFMRRRRLRVSGRADFGHAAIATGGARRTREAQEQFMKEYRAVAQNVSPGMRRFGAAALDLAYVAAGRYEGFWERNLKPWDIAAGILIVREAGGFVADLDDDRKNPAETGNLVAANDKIFANLKKVLQTV